VQLLGFVPEGQLAKYYQASDLVVMPTLQLEGFGLVTVEALACGTPVMGTPVGAIPEVLRTVDPLLVTEGTDGVSLANTLRLVLKRFRDQPGERERFAKKGREVVERRYNWKAHTADLDRLFVTLSKNRQSVPHQSVRARKVIHVITRLVMTVCSLSRWWLPGIQVAGMRKAGRPQLMRIVGYLIRQKFVGCCFLR
jgi:hypothetical protein